MSLPPSVWSDRPWPRRSWAITRYPSARKNIIWLSQSSALNGQPWWNMTAQCHEEMPLGKPHKRPPLAHRQINGGFAVTLRTTAVFDASKGAGDGVQLVWEPRYETAWSTSMCIGSWRQDAAGLVMAWRRKHVCSGNERTCTVGAWQVYIDRSGPIGFVDAVDTSSNWVSTPRPRSLSRWSSIIGDTGAAVTRPRWKRRSRSLALGNRKCASWPRIQRACRRLSPRLEPLS